MLKFVAGLVLGALIGFGAAHFVPRKATQDPWIDAGLVWETLPSHAVLGPLPQSVKVPAKAYDYGAATRPLGPLIKAQPSILRLEVEATAGRAGVVLSSPDGAALVSQEKVVEPSMGRIKVYFRITPQTPPSIIVVRNYDLDGTPGAMTIHSARYAAQSSLPVEALSEVNQAGVN